MRRARSICDGISIGKLRCYVMVGYGGESVAEAEAALEAVYRLGFLPFAQLYRADPPRTYSPEWRALARKWSRPAAYRKAVVSA